MKIIIGLGLLLLLFGCLGEESKESPIKTIEEKQPQEQVKEPAKEVPGILEVPKESEIIQDKKDAGIAKTQADCATLSPNCGTCTAREGCGWCKSSNSCFLGDENGPKVSSCEPDDWTYYENHCDGPKGGGNCEEQWNCADCLTGSGCKWCIQGAVCANEDSNKECFGGWMTQSFQCNYASR